MSIPNAAASGYARGVVDPLASAEDRELEFELEFLRGLTTAQRFDLMFRKSRQMDRSRS